MFRNSNGFLLVDALIGLAIFMLVLSSMTPLLIRVYQEKQAVSEERFAISELHNQLEEWLSNGELMREKQIEHENVLFQLQMTNVQNGVELCITWKGSNKRTDRICGEAK